MLNRLPLALFLSLSLTLGAAATASAAGKTAAKPAAKPATTGVSDATVAATVTEFVDALSSVDDERVLKVLSPSDRLALRGKEDLIGIVYGRKLEKPVVKSFEKVEQAGKVVGVKAVVSIDEVDPVDSTRISKDRTWFLALDGNTLKVSLSSVWLDAGKVGEPQR